MNLTLWYVAPDEAAGKLSSPYMTCADGNDPHAIIAAQPFTVSLKAICVAEDHHRTLFEGLFPQDGVLILSSNSLGTKPAVQRVHYYQEHLPRATLIDSFLSDTVYLCDDYSGHERLWLEFHIMAVGVPQEERDTLVNKFTSLAETAGSIFPVALPYSFIASTVVKSVEQLLNATQQAKHLLSRRVAFYPHHPRTPTDAGASGSPDHNTPILRCGTYIIFAEAVDGNAYTLQADNSITPVPDVSYLVFMIDRESIPSPDWVTSQRVAMLLTQINQGNANSEQAPIVFLNNTLTGYSNFSKLQRYLELWQKKQGDENSLTAAEKALMLRIASIAEIQPFLPK
ncbi:MAG: hypothetical protein IMW89_14930 [Ktedonobacteraceae bacterium]|nr:hypothetical protein [Ktedonobacteraceae bacterium]